MAKRTKIKNGKFYLVEEQEHELTLTDIEAQLDQASNDLQHAQDVYAEVLVLKAEYEANFPKKEIL